MGSHTYLQKDAGSYKGARPLYLPVVEGKQPLQPPRGHPSLAAGSWSWVTQRRATVVLMFREPGTCWVSCCHPRFQSFFASLC